VKQRTLEGHSSRLDEQKIESMKLKIKWKLKKKTEELSVKQLKTFKSNMHSIKTPNLRIKGIEAGEEVQAKGIQKNNNRKCPKPTESYAHSGTGSLQDTKQT
jgi:hypothetical protein